MSKKRSDPPEKRNRKKDPDTEPPEKHFCDGPVRHSRGLLLDNRYSFRIMTNPLLMDNELSFKLVSENGKPLLMDNEYSFQLVREPVPAADHPSRDGGPGP